MVHTDRCRGSFDCVRDSAFTRSSTSYRVTLTTLHQLFRGSDTVLGSIGGGNRCLGSSLLRLGTTCPSIVTSIHKHNLLLNFRLRSLANDDSLIRTSTRCGSTLNCVVTNCLLRFRSLQITPSNDGTGIVHLRPPIYVAFRRVSNLVTSLRGIYSVLQHHSTFPLTTNVYTSDVRTIPTHRIDFRTARGLPGPSRGIHIITHITFVGRLVSTSVLDSISPSLSALDTRRGHRFVGHVTPRQHTTPVNPTLVHSGLNATIRFALCPLYVSSSTVTRCVTDNSLRGVHSRVTRHVHSTHTSNCDITKLNVCASVIAGGYRTLGVPSVTLASNGTLAVNVNLRTVRRNYGRRNLRLHRRATTIINTTNGVTSACTSLLSIRIRRLVLVNDNHSNSLQHLRGATRLVCTRTTQTVLGNITRRSQLTDHLHGLRNVSTLLRTRNGTTSLNRQIVHLIRRHLNTSTFVAIDGSLSILGRTHVILYTTGTPRPFLNTRRFTRGDIVYSVTIPLGISRGLTDRHSSILCVRNKVIRAPLNSNLTPGIHTCLGRNRLCTYVTRSILVKLSKVGRRCSCNSVDHRRIRRVHTLTTARNFDLTRFGAGGSL